MGVAVRLLLLVALSVTLIILLAMRVFVRSLSIPLLRRLLVVLLYRRLLLGLTVVRSLGRLVGALIICHDVFSPRATLCPAAVLCSSFDHDQDISSPAHLHMPIADMPSLRRG